MWVCGCVHVCVVYVCVGGLYVLFACMNTDRGHGRKRSQEREGVCVCVFVYVCVCLFCMYACVFACFYACLHACVCTLLSH